MIFEQFYLGCLSQASYLIGDEETKQAVIVDPRRDVDLYREKAAELGLHIQGVILTHIHADFVAGHLELCQDPGVKLYLGAAAKAQVPFEQLEDGQDLSLGSVRITALATPGHTLDAISLLVFDSRQSNDEPWAVLTGDTLFIGDVGRPDLVASKGMRASELAGMLYDSIHEKLLPLPDKTFVYPAHGAGSLCGKNLSADTYSTMGEQRASNYALQPMDRDQFVSVVTANQPTAPAYFQHAASTNLGPHPLLPEVLKAQRALGAAALLDWQAKGAQLLDTRSASDFAEGHWRGSINIGLDGRFASWAGAVLSSKDPIVLLAEHGKEEESAIRLSRIGFDRVVGYVSIDAKFFTDYAQHIERAKRVSVAQLSSEEKDPAERLVLDVRNPGECIDLVIPGSRNIPLGELSQRWHECGQQSEVVVVCASGYRSMIAASMLRAHGLANVSDLVGGMEAWQSSQPSAK